MRPITKIIGALTALVAGLLVFASPASAAHEESAALLGCGSKTIIGEGHINRISDGGAVGTVWLRGQTCVYEPNVTTYTRWASAVVPKLSPGWRAYVWLKRSDGRLQDCWINRRDDDYCETYALSHDSTGQEYKYSAGAKLQRYSNGRWIDYAVGGTGWR